MQVDPERQVAQEERGEGQAVRKHDLRVRTKSCIFSLGNPRSAVLTRNLRKKKWGKPNL